MLILSRFAPALLQIAITVFGAYSLITPGSLDNSAWLGLGALFLQAIVTYAVPLLDIQWQGILKTGLSAVLAALTLLIPLVAQGGEISSTQWSIVILAAFNALAAHLGIAIRKTGATLALATQNAGGVYNVTNVAPEKSLGADVSDEPAIG